MKFRSYQLLFVASIALLIVALIKPIINVIEPNGVTSIMDNFGYTLADGTVSRAVVALGVVLIVAVAVNAFAMFVSLFSNFALQKRSAILSMLLVAGYYILLLVYLLILDNGAAVEMLWPMFLPLTVLALDAFAFVLVRRHEAKIVAKALGFRLRD
ncbi:MAG: DUF4293 family protein [Bacteroidaceae bacterium]|jgi:hypothetical protein|nr:DUF4293 family protein [Bacteroidaceae bacterium]